MATIGAFFISFCNNNIDACLSFIFSFIVLIEYDCCKLLIMSFGFINYDRVVLIINLLKIKMLHVD